MNKMELNIIVNDIENYNTLKKFLKSRKITILGEYFPGDYGFPEDQKYLCNVEVLITMEDYTALAGDIGINVNFILNTAMSFPLMDDLNNLPFIKKYMIENIKSPKEDGNKEYWEGRLEKIEAFLGASHLFMLKMFKKNKKTITQFVNSKMLSTSDKIQDLNQMIEYFEGSPEDIESQRFEDCAFLQKIKKRIQKNETNKTKKSAERDTSNVAS
jgi:predicted phosphohydrolase